MRFADCGESRPTLHRVLRDLLETDGVREVTVPGSSLGVMALHGGLEEGTFEIARTIADVTGASLYAVVQPEDVRWHVPSIHFDPAHSDALRRFIASVRFAVSIHGFGRQFLSATALVGGANADAADRVAAGLRRRGFTAVSDRNAIPKRLRGLHGKNPVNLPSRGGVQVELTPDLRRLPVRRKLAAALAAEVEVLAPVWA